MILILLNVHSNDVINAVHSGLSQCPLGFGYHGYKEHSLGNNMNFHHS